MFTTPQINVLTAAYSSEEVSARLTKWADRLATRALRSADVTFDDESRRSRMLGVALGKVERTPDFQEAMRWAAKADAINASIYSSKKNVASKVTAIDYALRALSRAKIQPSDNESFDDAFDAEWLRMCAAVSSKIWRVVREPAIDELARKIENLKQVAAGVSEGAALAEAA